MIIKSYIIEKNIQNLNKYKSLLFYGENDGLINYFKQKIKNINKDKELVIIFQEDMAANKDLLIDMVLNRSLFAKNKTIIINEADDKFFEIIEQAVSKSDETVKIYVFTSKLDKRSKLRKYFEIEKDLASISCYKDSERTLSEYISKELNNYEGLTNEVKSLIVNNCNMDRRIISELIIKIKMLFLNKIIDKEKVVKLIDPKITKNFDEIRDISLIGNKNKLNQLLSEIDLTSDDSFYILNLINLKLQKLTQLIFDKENTNNIRELIDNCKPPIFWKEKQSYIDLVIKWDEDRINVVLNKSKNAELEIKKHTAKNDVVIKKLLLDICTQASTFK